MTLAEKILWSKLRRRQIKGYKFRRQQVVLDYIVDFYCNDLKLAIEVDGEIHALPEIKISDKRRNRMLTINGYKVIHLTNDQVISNLSDTIARINLHISKISSPFQGDHRGACR